MDSKAGGGRTEEKRIWKISEVKSKIAMTADGLGVLTSFATYHALAATGHTRPAIVSIEES